MSTAFDASSNSGEPVGLRSRRQVVADLRFNLNWQWTAVKMQYERLASNALSKDDAMDALLHKHMTGIVDLDFLVMSVQRLLRVADQAKRSGIDYDGVLKPLIQDFNASWPRIVDARNALEHFEDPRPARAFVPSSSLDGAWRFEMAGASIDGRLLFESAEALATAVSAVIRSYEAEQDAAEAG